MSPELAEKFPEIKTFDGQGIDDPSASVRVDSSPIGFRAQILSANGAVYIEPRASGETNFYVTFFKSDLLKTDEFACLTEPGETMKAAEAFSTKAVAVSGNVLRTYRLAVAAQGEYTDFHGGTVAGAMAAIVTTVNRVNGIYERELGIRFNLVGNNDAIIFTSASGDPYSVNGPSTTTLLENQSTIDRIIGVNNYDVGIVFNTGNTGVAQIRSVCVDQFKARACIGSPNPTGDAFWVGFVAHEIGHMFGAEHTFNGAGGLCNGRGNIYTAYEPGGGSTIMAYAGLCGGDSFQSQSDPYFHTMSLQQIYEFISGGNDCASLSPTGNRPAHVHAQSGATIPKGTPFKLTATGNDDDGDSISFCWEEFDLGPVQSLSAPDNGSSPLFRSFPPTLDPSRTFPRMEDILRNRLTPGEKMPMTTRGMSFRVTARDGRVGGALEWERMEIAVHAGAGPFFIVAPGPSTTWFGLRSHQVIWDVANTSVTPINTTALRILLSTNGGTDFNIVVAANTPNDGSEGVVFPNVPVAHARIKVEAIGNIFFDISDAFSIDETIPPTIITHPQSQNVVLTNAMFQVEASGSPPFDYQWQFNDQDIPGATNASYPFVVSSTSQSGLYRVRVSNPAGVVLSDAAQLNVVVELIKPNISITGRLPSRVTDAVVNVSGVASDNAALREIRWRIDDQPFQIATGVANWSAAVALVPGTNVFEAISIDTSGNESVPAKHKFFYVVTSPLTVSANGGGSIKPNLNAQPLEVGGGYKMIAKANKGQVFAGWSGGINASESTLNFVMQSNLVLQANFVPNPFAPIKGIYSGLFFQTNQVRHESSGFLTLKISDQGKFSGKVFIAGKPYSLSGAFNGIGQTTRPIRIARTNFVTASLRMDLTNGTDQITGNISNETWIAEVSANRLVFNGKSNRAPQAGKHTAVLRRNANSADTPAGTSFATLTVSDAGALRMSGLLADGSRMTQSTSLSKDGQWPFYVSLYKGKGSVLGWIHFVSTETNNVSGDVSWIKSAGVKDKFFPAGFTNDVVLSGSHFTSANHVPVLNFSNGILTWSDGNLSVPFVSSVTLNKNKIIAPASSAKTSLTINAGSGLVSGSFIHPETNKRTAIKGVVLQQQNIAEGFFLGRDSSGTMALEEVK